MKRSRVIFDHLLKTGGQSLNHYLVDRFGPYWVTPNIEGCHRDLISQYGGDYSVLSAHIEFDGSGLDPRYDYITILRDPIERVLSWLHFVKDVVDRDNRNLHLQRAAAEFIDSDGEVVDRLIHEVVSNYYVRHFQSCVMQGDLTESSLDVAMDVLSQYEMVLFTDNLNNSTADIDAFFGCNEEGAVGYQNKNLVSDRADISKKLYQRVADINGMDVTLYAMARRGQIEKARRAYDCRAFMHRTRVTPVAKAHPIPAHWTSPSLRKYLASDLVVGAGHAAGTSVVGDGRPNRGYLLSGPFLSANPGSYIMVVHARLEKKGDGILIHVTGDAGRSTYAKFLSSNTSDKAITVFLARTFDLKESVSDLEVKIAATEQEAGTAKSVEQSPACEAPPLESCLEIETGDHRAKCVPTIFSVSILDVKKIEAQNQAIASTIAALRNEPSTPLAYRSRLHAHNTEVGTYTSLTIETRGEEGMLFCRGFTSLNRGRHQFFLFGELGPNGLAGAALMLLRDDGRTVVQTKRLRSFVDRTPSARHGLIAEPIVVDIEEDADDIEICIYVTAQSEFSLRNVSAVNTAASGESSVASSANHRADELTLAQPARTS